MSTSNVMSLIFSSDGSVTNGGFEIQYSEEDPREEGMNYRTSISLISVRNDIFIIIKPIG